MARELIELFLTPSRVPRSLLSSRVSISIPWTLLVGVLLVVPRQASINHMQVHILVSESHDSDQSLPTVPLVPSDDVFPSDLVAQFPRAGLAPGLVLFGRIDSGEAYPMLSVCDLEHYGVTTVCPARFAQALSSRSWLSVVCWSVLTRV